MREFTPDVCITGMANGYDLWYADEALLQGIEVWAARPWRGHAPRSGDEELYARVFGEASRVVNVVEDYDYPGAWCYHARNHWMVDNATHVLAYLDPEKKSGGTYQCVRYAHEKGKPVKNLYG